MRCEITASIAAQGSGARSDKVPDVRNEGKAHAAHLGRAAATKYVAQLIVIIMQTHSISAFWNGNKTESQIGPSGFEPPPSLL